MVKEKTNGYNKQRNKEDKMIEKLMRRKKNGRNEMD